MKTINLKCVTYSMGLVITDAVISSDQDLKKQVEDPRNGYVKCAGGWVKDEAQGQIFRYFPKIDAYEPRSKD